MTAWRGASVAFVTAGLLCAVAFCALFLAMRASGLFGYRLIDIANPQHLVTRCPAATMGEADSADDPPRLLAEIGESALPREAAMRRFVCALNAGGIDARIVVLIKSPLRSQNLLGAEYRQGESWRFVDVARGAAVRIGDSPVSALEIVRSFYTGAFRELAADGGRAEESLRALHKAHFVLYLESTETPLLGRLPVLRAWFGPIAHVDARTFDGHLEDLALYRLLFALLHIYLPALAVASLAIGWLCRLAMR